MNDFEKWSIWITSVLTGLTGVGYFWAKHLVEPADPFAVVNHPLQPWLLKAHILVSPLLLVALGAILVRHVWKHVRLGVQWARRSGLVTGLVLLPMVATGYLIQAVTNQGWLQAMVVAHLVTGFVYLGGLGLHHVAVHFMRPCRDDCRREPACDRDAGEGGECAVVRKVEEVEGRDPLPVLRRGTGGSYGGRGAPLVRASGNGASGGSPPAGRRGGRASSRRTDEAAAG